MSIFSKKSTEEEANIQTIIENYGGNPEVEAKESKLVEDLYAFFNRRNLTLLQQKSGVKIIIDTFTDNLIELVLSDETVIKAMKNSGSNPKNFIRIIVGKFRPR